MKQDRRKDQSPGDIRRSRGLEEGTTRLLTFRQSSDRIKIHHKSCNKRNKTHDYALKIRPVEQRQKHLSELACGLRVLNQAAIVLCMIHSMKEWGQIDMFFYMRHF